MCSSARLLFPLFLLSSIAALGQIAPVCDVTCAPDPTSSSYTPDVSSRTKIQNLRGRRLERSPEIRAGEGDMTTGNLIGSQSVDYAVPLLALPGRAGLDLNLALRYNSRVWDVNPSDSTATFNTDRDFPSYGFRLDFGYIEHDTTNGLFILTESDGTKHSMPGSSSTYDSNDGSHIEFNSSTNVLVYPNGLKIQYQLFPSQSGTGTQTLFRPTQITDTNGNYISITYVSGHDQNINTITDTLGRVITFNYSSGQLSNITEAISGGTFTVASFTWGTTTLTYNFASPLTVPNTQSSGTTISVLTAVTLPDTTYYKFTYGYWGIVNRIEHFSGNSTPTSRSYVRFDFPNTSTALSDAPGYTHEYVSTDGGSTESTWTYSQTVSSGVVTGSTITDPTGAKTEMTLAGSSDPCPGAVSILKMETSSSSVLRRVDNTYDSSCQLTTAVTTLDSGQKSEVDYSYDSFGNVTEEKVYDFGTSSVGALLRDTFTTYPTSPSDHVLNLASKIEVYNGSSVKVSRTDLAYDETAPSSLSSGTLLQHTTPSTRGNLTTITRYTNASAGSGAISRTFAYDIVGNMVTGHLNCCNEKQWNYSSTTQWAYPDSIVRDPSGLALTTSATYDFYSGLMATSTDENSKTTSYSYDSARRVYQVTQPNSVVLTTTYDDTSANPAVTQSNSANSLVKVTKMDGTGNVLERDAKSSSTLVSKVTYAYDGLGRVTSQSNPYSSGSAVNTTTSYDAIGRVTAVAPPSAGSYGYAYSGNATTITDPQSKQRRNVTDVLGRLKEVDEPGDPSSSTDGTGTAVISGSLQSRLEGGHSAAAGSKSITITGDEQSAYHYYDSGPFWDSDCQCWVDGYYVYDYGTVSITVGGHTDYISYDQYTNSNSASVAYALAGAINGDSSALVTASSSGSTLTVTAKTTGSSTNYSYSIGSSTSDSTDFYAGSFGGSPSSGSLAGGLDYYAGSTVYDTGTVTMTVGSFTTSAVTYSSSSNNTASAVASSLATLLNGTGSPVNATTSGATITMTTRSGTGSYSASVSSSSTNGFSSASFTSTGGSVHGSTIDYPYTTIYAYDANGNLTGVTQGSQTRTYTYDSLGRATSVALPESGTTTYTYYDHDRVHTRTDARGVVTTYSYTNVYQPYQISYDVSGASGVPSTSTVTFTYGTSTSSNNNDRLTNMSDGTGSEAYTYDNMGRVTSVAKTISSVAYTSSYAYNDDNTLQKLTYPSSSSRYMSQTYDAIGRLATITNSGSTILTVSTYNDASQPTGLTYGNGVTGAMTYNDHLQLATLKYNSGSLLDLTYDYGTYNNGQIHAITAYGDATKSVTYTYDALGRLSHAETGNLTGTDTWCLDWAYDRYGNRLSQTACSSPGTLSVYQPSLTVSTSTNRITGGTYAYDANGNMTEDGSSNTYVYDAENRMVSFTSGSTTHNYYYDGNNQRVKKDSTVYIYSVNKVIAEYPSGGAASTPNTEYMYSGSGLLQTIVGSTVTYHHPDHLSNRVDTNSSGTSIRTFGHLPFGDVWYEPAGTDKWKFTSYERDSESGLDYAINRYHSSQIGRFASPDLLAGNIGNPQSLNRYAYSLNDPVNLSDPLGLDPGDFTLSRTVWAPYFPEGIGGGGGDRIIAPDVEQGGGGNSAPAPVKKSDCEKLADTVDQIANEVIGKMPDKPGADVQAFMDRLAKTFTEISSATMGGLYDRDNRGYEAHGSSGFADPYYEEPDGGYPSNQVRHAVAGMVVGYVLGATVGLRAMNAREDSSDAKHGVPDINLNGKTVPMGSQLAASPPEGAKAVWKLGDWIRNTLCDKKNGDKP